MLAATPNQHSSGLRRRCSTCPIENYRIALMQCPSVLSAPTSMDHFYSLNAILQPPHTIRRYDIVLATISNQASFSLRRSFSMQLQVQNGRVEYISFYTIVTNYNRPLAAEIARIDVATYIKVANCEATSTLILTLIRTESIALASWSHGIFTRARVQFLQYYRYQLQWATSSGYCPY